MRMRMKQAFRDQNRLLVIGGYLTLPPYLIVDAGLQNPYLRLCLSPFLSGLIRKKALIFDEFRSIS